MNRVWFITGAARGMGGGHIAKAALQQGDHVVATGRNMDILRQIFSTVCLRPAFQEHVIVSKRTINSLT